MHGKQRMRLRENSKTSIRRAQRLSQQGRWGRIIKTIMSNNAAPYTLDTLKLSDGTVTDNKYTIHRECTNFFAREWFGNKPHLNFGFHKPDADIMRLLTDEDYFYREHLAISIIWRALQAPSVKLDTPEANSSSLRLQMASVISEPPTREEYNRCLASTGNTTVGGMSGLTYSMMKAWPEEVTDQAFAALLQLWEDKSTPEWWQWRWMCPKPKVTEDVKLTDLRPLVLVEVTRKLWTGIIITRIKNLWEREQLLHQGQHAFRSKHGTDTATLQLINALEQARESCAQIFLSSWDMKRAFDSVAKNVLAASWIRLGVPHDIAMWLTNLDTNGKTFFFFERSHGYKLHTKVQSKRVLLSAARQPSSLVQEPGSRPAEFLVAAARRAATLFSAHYDVIRPLTRLPEAGVVNSWLYTVGIFTGVCA